jgi:MraZ protein
MVFPCPQAGGRRAGSFARNVSGDWTPGGGTRGYSILGHFSGAYLNGIDAKHRLSVPAPIREVVEQRSQMRQIVLAPAEHAPCLIGYDVGYFDQLKATMAERFAGDFGPGRSTTARTLFAMADVLKYEENGRCILSQILLDLGELKRQALFLGAGDYFELWAPEQLLAQPDQDPRLLRMVRALLAQKDAQ